MQLLRPTGNRVLVRPIAAVDKSSGGIMFAQSWQTPSGQADIIGVGRRVTEPSLKIGARIFYNWINGRQVEHNGEECRLLDVADILGVEDHEPTNERAELPANPDEPDAGIRQPAQAQQAGEETPGQQAA